MLAATYCASTQLRYDMRYCHDFSLRYAIDAAATLMPFYAIDVLRGYARPPRCAYVEHTYTY